MRSFAFAPLASFALLALACGSTSGVGGNQGSGSESGGGPVAEVHFIGRFTNEAEPRFAWPGSTILARFSGTGLDVRLADGGNNHFAVVIDDGPPIDLATSSAKDTYTLAANLPAGEHTVFLEKRTESFVGVVRFKGFVPAPGGALVPTPAPFRRKIELVGDSITCGYGNTGAGPLCPFSPETEDEYAAYGAIAARKLGAAHVGISYSGIGVYRDYNGATQDQMPVRFGRTLADDPASTWDFSYTPDVVVVNLGTNDFAKGDPGQAYIDALSGFLDKLRGHYPSAYLLCAAGSMLTDGYPAGAMHLTKVKQHISAALDVRKAKGDTNVGFVDLGVQDSAVDGIGCDYHPSLATHQKMADKLVAALQSAKGW
ncbi:SGNH/GDSL hydrolase family protein [Polyangium sp. 6x1]|uniref:SGNH/GDSL hydrolase family protein n=1 Tax=Polyangium sp. 6x1 TaxID=3042689 RepID=UPI002482E61E|nr:SGNH/GDSL hydrolase family protein [Polyangium sp. 6x1]MDI1447946.1 SGNH/GDSL hydrolase family protein [Polyangium sp. 6x1]